MAGITIRNLDDDDVKTRLRVRAAGHHRSKGEETRIILRDAVDDARERPRDLAKFRRRDELEAAMARWLNIGFILKAGLSETFLPAGLRVEDTG